MPVALVVKARRLAPWPFVAAGYGTAGEVGNDGTVLDAPEIDGTLTVTATDGDAREPPRVAGATRARRRR